MSEKLRREISQLSVEERLQLIGEIWDDIATEDQVPPLSEAQRAELDRRLEEHEQDPNSAIPWEEVRQELWDLVSKSKS